VSTPLKLTVESLAAALGPRVRGFDQEGCTWFKELALHSRPLLAVLLVEAALELMDTRNASRNVSLDDLRDDLRDDLLDDLLDAVALGLKKTKDTHTNLYGVLGTWRSFECASMAFALEKPTAEGHLIVSHFALVHIRGCEDDEPANDPVKIVNSNGQLKLQQKEGEKEGKPFVLECFFPTPSDDPLFHLAIHGTRAHPPFLTKVGEASTAHAALWILKNPQDYAIKPSQTRCDINTRANKSTGTELEVLLVNSAVAASRGGGVGGSSLDAFVGRLLAHSTTATKDADVTSDSLLVNPLSSFLKANPGVRAGQVPCLFAPSPKRASVAENTCDVNPNILKLGCMGQLLRPADKVGMDGIFLHSSFNGEHCIDVFLEAKDYRAALAVGVLSKCITRAHSQVCRRKCPQESCTCARVLFIFCNTVSTEAFKKKKPVSITHNKKTVECTTKILKATRPNPNGRFELDFLNDTCRSLSEEKEDLLVVVVPLKELGSQVTFGKDEPEEEEEREDIHGGAAVSGSTG
jgi:hypothetical protein